MSEHDVWELADVLYSGADRKMVRYRSRRPPDTELRGRLRELANEPPSVRLP
jgi:hypothetical protein